MTAIVRRSGAAAILDLWHRADDIRRDWLAVGLDTRPADRDTTESILTRFYRRQGRDAPRFVWVDSPAAALPFTAGIPSHHDLHAWLRPDPPRGRPPVALDIAASWSRLLAALDDAADHPDLAPARKLRKGERPGPELPPEAALAAGASLRVVLHQGVRAALRTALMVQVALPVRASLGHTARLPICWYGQQDAAWIAYHDALHRLGLSEPALRDSKQLDDWAALARSTGWWWPGDEVCVLVERPAVFGPAAVEYRDGSRVRVGSDG
ncbi:DUF6745 domain-containing protein [Actinoplanes sp. NPDC051859]|uniref:DUF6745 domain-containing protein n=1 Tax=Actinoplanes sp. NPDC051859 TaxID=3363909 RepID=UPI0037960BAB